MKRSLNVFILFSVLFMVTITVKAQENLTLEEFFNSGELYEGKEVVVTGMVKGVCQKSGKKAFLIGNDPKEVLKVLAGGKIAMFDKSLIGQDLRVKGIVLVKKIDKAYLDNWAEELAKTETCEDEKHDHKEHEASEQTNCSVAYKKYNELKKLVEKSGKGYFPILSIDGLSYDVVEI